jgi:hypothetical protein
MRVFPLSGERFGHSYVRHFLRIYSIQPAGVELLVYCDKPFVRKLWTWKVNKIPFVLVKPLLQLEKDQKKKTVGHG